MVVTFTFAAAKCCVALGERRRATATRPPETTGLVSTLRTAPTGKALVDVI
jgi:hypothetical protein